VLLDVSGQNASTGAFPCGETGSCRATVTVPLKPEVPSSGRRLLSSATPVCLQMSADQTAFVVDQSTSSCCTATAASGSSAATLTVTCGGTYLLGDYTPPSTGAPSGVDAWVRWPTADTATATTANDTTATGTDSAGGSELSSQTGASPSPSSPSAGENGTAADAPFVAPAATRPYAFSLTFDANYTALVADPARVESFKADLRASVAAGVANATGAPVTAANVEVGELRAGSIIAPVTVHAPADWTADQVARAADVITASPESLFTDEFRTAYQVGGVTATLSAATPLPAAAGAGGLTAGQKAGIAIGVIAAVAVAAAAAFVVWQKRQRARTEETAAAQYAAPLQPV
jgi:hypothetical protein